MIFGGNRPVGTPSRRPLLGGGWGASALRFRDDGGRSGLVGGGSGCRSCVQRADTPLTPPTQRERRPAAPDPAPEGLAPTLHQRGAFRALSSGAWARIPPAAAAVAPQWPKLTYCTPTNRPPPLPHVQNPRDRPWSGGGRTDLQWGPGPGSLWEERERMCGALVQEKARLVVLMAGTEARIGGEPVYNEPNEL